jgi:hypothetical protein
MISLIMSDMRLSSHIIPYHSLKVVLWKLETLFEGHPGLVHPTYIG